MRTLILILLVLVSPITEARRSKNYAFLINSSKFWFNYRQTTNSLLIYNFLKENGIPDENVYQDHHLNPRLSKWIPRISHAVAVTSILVPKNPNFYFRGKVTSIDEKYEPNVYANSRNDYKMDDVSVENILGVISNRLDPRVIWKFNERFLDSLWKTTDAGLWLNGPSVHERTWWWQLL